MIPIKVILTNFVSHIHSILDFTKFNYALIVGSHENHPNISNGVGKTALIDSIRFALFGKTKFNTKTKVVKHGKEFCQVEFIFSMNGEIYKVIRKLSAKTGIIIVVDFFRNNGNKWESLTCDTPTQTNNRIVEIVGMNDDTFVNILYFRQNDVSGFTSANATKRKEILKEGLRIGIWDEYQKVAKDSEKSLLQQLDVLEDRIKLLGNVEADLKVVSDKLINKQAQLKKFQEEMLEVEDRVKECGDNITDLEISIAKCKLINNDKIKKELDNISKRGQEIVNRKNSLLSSVKKNNEDLSKANNDCSELLKRAANYYKDVLITTNNHNSEFKSEFKKISNEKIPKELYSIESLNNNKEQKSKIIQSVNEIKFDLKQLTTLSPGEKCPTCLAIIKNPKEIIHKREEKRELLENEIRKLENLLTDINSKIQTEENALLKANESFVEIERTNLIIAKRMAFISEINRDNERIQIELKSLASEWQNLKDKKSELSLELKSIEGEANLYKDLSELFEIRKNLDLSINSSKEKILKASLECGNLEGNKESLEQKMSEKNVLLDKKKELISNIEVYSKLSTAFGKDGIQSIIMENITEDLKQYTNSILKNIYYKPISIEFLTQKQTTAGTWKEDFEILISIDNEIYDFEDVSGGEQVRISIAIRLALSHLLMKRVGSNIKFLLFDEVDQSLDRHGLEAFCDTIEELSKEFKILVISHNEYIKEKFENIITVHMGQDGTILK